MPSIFNPVSLGVKSNGKCKAFSSQFRAAEHEARRFALCSKSQSKGQIGANVNLLFRNLWNQLPPHHLSTRLLYFPIIRKPCCYFKTCELQDNKFNTCCLFEMLHKSVAHIQSCISVLMCLQHLEKTQTQSWTFTVNKRSYKEGLLVKLTAAAREIHIFMLLRK